MMSSLDIKTRIEIVELFHQNNGSAAQTLRRFKTKHQMNKDPFTLSTITRLVKKFHETGSVLDLPKSGRPSVSEEVVEEVKAANKQGKTISPTGCFSAHDISKSTAIPYSTVRKILRYKLKQRPYHLKRVQALHEGDLEKRVNFAEWFLEQEDNIISNILWSDEAHFYLNGYVSSRHCVIWSEDNPHHNLEVPLHSPKVTVFCAMNSRMIMPPYFIEHPNTVNQHVYLDILQNHVVPNLPNNNLIFMQDGATPHTANIVKDFLRQQFGENLIGLGFQREWPPRSPDLNPLDFFLWGYLKLRVFRRKPSTIDQLKDFIVMEINCIEAELLARAVESLSDRCLAVICENGNHIEN